MHLHHDAFVESTPTTSSFQFFLIYKLLSRLFTRMETTGTGKATFGVGTKNVSGGKEEF
jgi:hypothetical protein